MIRSAAAALRSSVEPPPQPRLPGADESHLWHASVLRTDAQVARLERTLSRDERERARRYAAPRDRRRFVVARGLLRALLGRYLERDPASVAFAYGRSGKPELAGGQNEADLRFNLAHSGGVVLYAFARGRAVGVDVEELRPLDEFDALSRTVFSLREREELQAQPPSRRLRAFFDGWVRKEAVLKGSGDGLGAELPATEVSLARSDGPLPRAVHGDDRARTTWTLRNVPMGPRYAAAVAVAGPQGGTSQGRVAARRSTPSRTPGVRVVRLRAPEEFA